MTPRSCHRHSSEELCFPFVHTALPPAVPPQGTKKPGLAFFGASHHAGGARLHALQKHFSKNCNKFYNEHLPCQPSTFLENSTTANCIPRHTPCWWKGKHKGSSTEKQLLHFTSACPDSVSPLPTEQQSQTLLLSLLPTSTPCCVLSVISFQKLGLSFQKSPHMKGQVLEATQF